MLTDELLAEALRFLRPERARVAGELLSSLARRIRRGGRDRLELERRARDVSEGRVQTTS